MRLSEMPVILVDAQTTGATPVQGRLLELAWCTTRGNDASDVAAKARSFLLQGPNGSSEDVAARILKLTGIVRDELATASLESEVFEMLARDLAPPFDGIVVAHFATFEARFLEDLWQRLGKTSFPAELICTHAICRRLFPDLPSRSLRAVAGYFGAPLSPSKRAAAHVEATAHIWARLCAELEARAGIVTVEDLREWLARKAPAHSGARRYAIERTLRLGLPDRPGIYKFLGSDGRVLYVGKATSLKSRVNSYFRQRKGHSSTKLEMLTQAFGLETVACETALEAALLESDEIKRLNPPYNIALRQEERRVTFFDRDWRPVDEDAARYGPFASTHAIDHLKALHLTLAGLITVEDAAELLFYEPVDPDSVREGLALFRAEQALPEHWPALTLRQLLARGLVRARQLAGADDEAEVDDEADGATEVDAADERDEPLTPPDVAAHFANILLTSARAYLRARRLRRSLDSAVTWRRPGERLWRWLVVRRGVIVDSGYTDDALPPAFPSLAEVPPLPEGKGIDIPSYDRVRVLTSELGRLASEGAEVILRFSDDLEGTRHGMDRQLPPTHRRAPAHDGADSPRMSP